METIQQALSLGFIGGSIRSAIGQTHAIACQMDNKWTLKAGCFSTENNINIITAETYGIDKNRLYNSWEDLLVQEREKLDAIVLLTPTPLHYEIVINILKLGIPIICEKSLAMTSDELIDIINTENKNNGFVAITYNYSGYPAVRELRAMIENGILGEILHFQMEMPQEGYIKKDSNGNPSKIQSWRLEKKKNPLIHLDLFSHLHHLIYYLLRIRPLSVISDQQSYGWFSDVIDNVVCLCKYSNNVHGQVWFSKSALGYRNGLRLRIYGSKASAEWYQANPEELIVSHVDGRRNVIDRGSSTFLLSEKRYNRFKAGHPSGFIEAFANLYSDIADSLYSYKETNSIPNNDEVFGSTLALEGMKMIEAMIKSTTTNMWEFI